MGATEYYTLDFFHNVPKEFSRNQELMQLFEMQDGAVSTVKNWIGNYRLFFGLFHLLVKNAGFVGILVVIVLLVVVKNTAIKYSPDLKNQSVSPKRFKTIMKYGS